MTVLNAPLKVPKCNCINYPLLTIVANIWKVFPSFSLEHQQELDRCLSTILLLLLSACRILSKKFILRMAGEELVHAVV